MKTIIKRVILCAVLFSCVAFSLKLRLLPVTPKASDLSDHFGTVPQSNSYGPRADGNMIPLAREGVSPGQTSEITPITNFNQEINPKAVVAGELNNTSYDASKIIRAQIAGT